MSEALDYQRIRRADAFSAAITVLGDAAVEGKFAHDPDLWWDIEELVIPLLEAEAYQRRQRA